MYTHNKKRIYIYIYIYIIPSSVLGPPGAQSPQNYTGAWPQRPEDPRRESPLAPRKKLTYTCIYIYVYIYIYIYTTIVQYTIQSHTTIL